MGRVLRNAGRIGIGLAVTAAASVSAIDAHAAGAPKLTVTAAFTKTSYVSGQSVSVRITIHNSGTATAVGVGADQQSGSGAMATDHGQLGGLAGSNTIAAGTSKTFTVNGQLGDLKATEVTLTGGVFDRNDDEDLPFSAKARVYVRTAVVHGTVYGDKNGNGKADKGEGLAGVPITFGYDYGSTTVSVRTGSGGRFTATVPTASYTVTGGHKPWYVVTHATTVLSKGGSLELRAVQPLRKGQLAASIRFTKRSYRVGAIAHMTVTLKNTGSAQLSGITAACDRVGNSNELTGGGWSGLNGAGVHLNAHATRTFEVTGKVPSRASGAGYVLIACDFGYYALDAGVRPQAAATARVPGHSETVTLSVDYRSGNSEKPVKGVRLVLVDQTVCPLFRRTVTTNAKGAAVLHKVPAGPSYRLYAFPPKGWKVLGRNPTGVQVFADGDGLGYGDQAGFEAARGTAKAPKLPTRCS